MKKGYWHYTKELNADIILTGCRDANEAKLKEVLKMAEKINVDELQLRVQQLDGEVETIRDRIRQYGLEEIFETMPEVEDKGELTDKYVATLDALRTCLLRFITRLSQLQKETQTEHF